MTGFERRTVLRGAAVAAAAGVPFQALSARAAEARPARFGCDPGYGPLQPARDRTTGLELLRLPRGFEYASHGWTNDRMDDGTPTPGAHDGMAAFRRGRHLQLVRNHERGPGDAFTAPAYDPAAGGGTTTLAFDPVRGEWLESYGSLGGTIRNCAGGPTPWDTWLTCEETFSTVRERHGYIFEVPLEGKGDPAPYTAMGRFNHEAVAVDPRTGYVYETEDRGDASMYRFIPAVPGDLSRGGRLEALRIGDGPYDTRGDGEGSYGRVSWVPVEDADPDEDTVRVEAQANGAAVFARLEGAWYGNRRIYVVSTSGGPAGEGQVFELNPVTGELRVLFASPSADVLNAPDNVCVSPRGGLLLCEDGSGVEYLHGLTTDGEIFPFAANNADLTGGTAGKDVPAEDYTGSEWAGATFEPRRGNWLFVNIQTPGITFAITGPWRRGGL